MQFAWLSVEEAKQFLVRAAPIDGNYGDRVAAMRRVVPPSDMDVIRRAEAIAYADAVEAGDHACIGRLLDAVRIRMVEHSAFLQQREEANRRRFAPQSTAGGRRVA